MKSAYPTIGSVVTSMRLSSTKLRLFVSFILRVFLEDERLQVFLLSLDSLLLRARWTRIDHTVEHAVYGEKGKGKMLSSEPESRFTWSIVEETSTMRLRRMTIATKVTARSHCPSAPSTSITRSRATPA